LGNFINKIAIPNLNQISFSQGRCALGCRDKKRNKRKKTTGRGKAGGTGKTILLFLFGERGKEII